MAAAPRVFGWLAAEAFSDAFRRRIVPAIAALALLSLLFVDTCTSCSPMVVSDGQPVAVPEIAGAGGLAMMVLLGLWTLVLAGVLAADHLVEPLKDGSAPLLLSRPVSRESYALARLAGAWAMAAFVGLAVVGAAGGLLAARQGLGGGPAVGALAFILVNALCVAALAMALSLWLGSTLTSLVVLGAVWGFASIEVALQLGGEPSGLLGGLARFGPPLAAGPLAALSPWLGANGPSDLHAGGVAVRAVAWAFGAAILLCVVFRRMELGNRT